MDSNWLFKSQNTLPLHNTTPSINWKYFVMKQVCLNPYIIKFPVCALFIIFQWMDIATPLFICSILHVSECNGVGNSTGLFNHHILKSFCLRHNTNQISVFMILFIYYITDIYIVSITLVTIWFNVLNTKLHKYSNIHIWVIRICNLLNLTTMEQISVFTDWNIYKLRDDHTLVRVKYCTKIQTTNVYQNSNQHLSIWT